MGAPDGEQPYGHLLSAPRRERPHCRAADQRDELAPIHLRLKELEQGIVTAQADLLEGVSRAAPAASTDLHLALHFRHHAASPRTAAGGHNPTFSVTFDDAR
jgi:hypothetical protein